MNINIDHRARMQLLMLLEKHSKESDNESVCAAYFYSIINEYVMDNVENQIEMAKISQKRNQHKDAELEELQKSGCAHCKVE